jgi:hypothetical protein
MLAAERRHGSNQAALIAFALALGPPRPLPAPTLSGAGSALPVQSTGSHDRLPDTCPWCGQVTEVACPQGAR